MLILAALTSITSQSCPISGYGAGQFVHDSDPVVVIVGKLEKADPGTETSRPAAFLIGRLAVG
jgi:hypothetical protein